MRVIVTYSGGKDSQASLLWTIKHLTKTPTVVFCDTGWEHPLTYKHVRETTEALGLELVVLKSKKYGGMVDLATQKKRWPSSQRRFCTSELKTIPMIDYILDTVKDDFIVVQGIRAAESANRAKMQAQGGGVYGGGYLLSDKATARKIEAYEQAAKRAAVIVLELSEREKQIIAELE